MIKVTLKDGSIKEVEQGISIYDLAKQISEGLARNATCGRVDGKVEDLRYELSGITQISDNMRKPLSKSIDDIKIFTLEDLLPESFGPENLA